MDLVGEVEDWLTYVDDHDDSKGELHQYNRSVAELAGWLSNRCDDQITEPILVASVDEAFDLAQSPAALWTSNEVGILTHSIKSSETCLRTSQGNIGKKKQRQLYITVSARMSRRATEFAQQEAERVIRALLFLILALDHPKAAAVRRSTLPDVTLDVLHRNAEIIGSWLGAYYGVRPQTKSIDSQIRNAITLIVEADHQFNDAVSLSLACAAMEAIAIRRDNDNTITSALAENAATMLEPDPNRRLDAIRVVKHLYRQRSSVLHGSSTSGVAADRYKARAICAALLYAAVQWRDFCDRMGTGRKVDDLFTELEAARAAGKPFVVSIDLPIRKLWEAKL